MMRDDDDLRRALIATAVAYVTAPHGAGAREILRGRLEQLSRRWRDYASGQRKARVEALYHAGEDDAVDRAHDDLVAAEHRLRMAERRHA